MEGIKLCWDWSSLPAVGNANWLRVVIQGLLVLIKPKPIILPRAGDKTVAQGPSQGPLAMCCLLDVGSQAGSEIIKGIAFPTKPAVLAGRKGIAIKLLIFFNILFIFVIWNFFWLRPWHVEAPRSGIKPVPQHWRKLQWQHQILNVLHHKGTPTIKSIDKE